MRKLSVHNLILSFALIAIALITASAIFLYPLNLVDGSTGGFLSGFYRLGASLAILFFGFYVAQKVSVKQRKIYYIIFLVLAILAQLVFLLTFVRPVYTDTGYVTTMAARLIEGNHQWYNYFYTYPNNVNVTLWWSYLLTPFHWLGVTHYAPILPWIQMLMLDLGIIYLSRSLRLVNRVLSTIFMFIALFYIPWFMYAVFPYNDVVAIALMMGVIGSLIRLLSNESSKQKWLHGTALMLMLGIAVTIRQNSVIILIALLLTILFSKQFNFKLKSGLIILGVFFSLLGTVSFHHFQKVEGFQSKPTMVTPSVRYVNMSWNPHTAGQIDGPDSFLYSNFPKKERAKLITDELKHRIKELGVLGVPKHAIKKIAFMFSLAYSNEDMGGLQINRPLLKYEWESTPFLEFIGNLFQPIYILLLALAMLAVINVLKNRKTIDPRILNLTIFSAFSIVGIFTFHILLWEVRDRYALPMLPFLLLLAAIGMQLLFGLLKKRQETVQLVTNKFVLLSLVLLMASFLVSFSRANDKVGRDGFVYNSGFALYTENGDELVSIPGKTTVETGTFNLKSPSNNLNIDFSKLSKEQLDQLRVTLIRTDQHQSWTLNLKQSWSSYPGQYPVGNYRLKIENISTYPVKTDVLQNLETTNLQGPSVKMNQKNVKGLNAIFSFTDHHDTTWINRYVYIFLHLIFVALLLIALAIKRRQRIN
ncbi:hypothetical protein [Fructobacillus evanidus]|uniref:Involved in glycosylation of proteins and lipid IVA (ArnT) n=1 Tax=Fructobacillus evanidus TaxID=3064281 RepID=A0ABN9Z065_9LACO|nr:PMT family glycosyltransferase ArnT/Agl22 [Fructobacillus sp. LMG 32999]CAK1250538.1 PMT family glycosyltransferase ArnT/Agl22 [Fructobacillus sp. LMG 32999]CAK1254267.1 PMT family glycosyltransferase ArnT/Agl22 [Fructobacillus sp. LMG 32999]CAK1254383.1 PMT family glycosyltransferase ArnT/Agl22 [Fructobacillus sp. LMG 32999]CAK1254725.1 PMT family glycosyltransferase ArnT/Agl22 [Fructobacillus sp. LMG 32999]